MPSSRLAPDRSERSRSGCSRRCEGSTSGVYQLEEYRGKDTPLMAVRAPADKRFRRAHVHPARKRSWPPSWRTVAAASLVSALGAYGVYRAADLVSAEALTVSRIAVKGTSRMSPGEVLALLDGLRGTSMVTANLESWRQRLLGSPWVADAAIRRVFPGTVSVVVEEREPLGIGRIGGS